MAFGWDDVALLGGSFLGQMFGGGGGEGQEMRSFSDVDTGDGHPVDPTALMQLGMQSVEGFGDVLKEILNRGIYLPGAYAQTPANFVGGGLPMPIGVWGEDPALNDAATHLFTPGFAWQGMFPQQQQGPTPVGRRGPAPSDAPETEDLTWTRGGGPGGRGGWNPRAGGYDLMAPQQEASAAIELLMDDEDLR